MGGMAVMLFATVFFTMAKSILIQISVIITLVMVIIIKVTISNSSILNGDQIFIEKESVKKSPLRIIWR